MGVEVARATAPDQPPAYFAARQALPGGAEGGIRTSFEKSRLRVARFLHTPLEQCFATYCSEEDMTNRRSPAWLESMR
jgi:hypothetical protein